ncbi:hypothetical protein [Phenylobacterium sp.]|uniref:hypothetical protein n=1 Tax=Phenylobacterium sp. TaxID=1871053 RepID=UPI0027311D59|nr:hypothetical protein [Phenylobacterium sp.]MDP2212993.1 hypothetical protein [Phenylobacterium sp.]
MRTRSAFGLSAALVIVAACAHQAAEAPAPMSWSYNHTQSEGMKLIYGQPQSDNVLVMLSCQPNSGLVEVAVTTPENTTHPVGLVSREARLSLTGEIAPTPTAGVGVLIDNAAVDSPTLRQFAETGELAVHARGKTSSTSARGQDRALVADFFGQCGQPV